MAVRLMRMTEDDYDKIGKEVKEGFSPSRHHSPDSLVSPEIFGSTARRPGEDKSLATDHLRGYIQLCKPVLNGLITSSGNNSRFAKILGCDKGLFEEVVSLSICYDTRADAYVDVDDVTSARGILWGPEILRKWVDEFDVEEALKEHLAYLLLGFIKGQELSGIGSFHRGKTDGFLAAGDWHFVPDDPSEDYSGFADYIGNSVFKSNESRLTYLINLQGHKDRLYCMFLSRIAVIPINMRPDTDENAHHPLSMAYADVIHANDSLQMMLSGMFDARTFADKYKELQRRVSELLVESDPLNVKKRSILEKLKSKQGHIRMHMLGRRVDYSGRSVITIDPFLSIRDIKLPKDMAPKLFRHHILSSMAHPNPEDWIGLDKNRKCNEKIQSEGLLEQVPVVIGRQPTLHKPSMRAFRAQLSDDRSIRINPLCVTGFNADFDGDQMWARVPVSKGAVAEVKNLMDISQNIYYPKTGECAIMPRQEIIYGLNVCTRTNLTKGAVVATYSDFSQVFAALFAQQIQVEDTVSCKGYTECAGRVAFAGCLTKAAFDTFGIVEITSKTIPRYVEYMFEHDVESALDNIDKMVTLGFKMAYLYPPTLNLLQEEDIEFKEEFKAFHASIAESLDQYDRGFEEESAYTMEYNDALSELDKNVSASLYNKIGKESGFVRLAESGARGSRSNLLQMYGYKGRIQKTASESFRAVIEHSYVEQLTPLEHFVSAYGGRQGLINKSLHTSKTGYAMRKMWHTTAPYVITCEDCGTTRGIDIKKSDIALFITDKAEINDTFRRIITGRYAAGSNQKIDPDTAKQLSETNSSITIRSVLTCKNPCCKLCYGNDPATHRPPATGLPVGLIAAQSIGEPGTQLSMDSFKKGGLASKTTTASAFERLDAYISCADIGNRKGKGKLFPSYDPIAWASGPIIESSLSDGTKSVAIEGHRRKVILPGDVKLRKVAKKGEGLFQTRGDYNLREILEYRDPSHALQDAQLYLIYTLYNIYKSDCLISMNHFEVLAAAMTMHMVISTDRKDLYVGQYHDSIQMLKGDLSHTKFRSTLIGVKEVPVYRPQFLSRIAMELVADGLATSLLLGLDDPLEYPVSRVLLGQKLHFGEDGQFMAERSNL